MGKRVDYGQVGLKFEVALWVDWMVEIDESEVYVTLLKRPIRSQIVNAAYRRKICVAAKRARDFFKPVRALELL